MFTCQRLCSCALNSYDRVQNVEMLMLSKWQRFLKVRDFQMIP